MRTCFLRSYLEIMVPMRFRYYIKIKKHMRIYVTMPKIILYICAKQINFLRNSTEGHFISWHWWQTCYFVDELCELQASWPVTSRVHKTYTAVNRCRRLQPLLTALKRVFVCLLWLTNNTCKYIYIRIDSGTQRWEEAGNLFFLLSCFYPHLVHMEKTKGDVHQPSNEYKSPIIQLQGTLMRNAIISGFPQSWKVIELQLVLEKSLNVR